MVLKWPKFREETPTKGSTLARERNDKYHLLSYAWVLMNQGAKFLNHEIHELLPIFRVK